MQVGRKTLMVDKEAKICMIQTIEVAESFYFL
jgi:hypothetical protein